MGKLIAFDWAIKTILRSKANFGILEDFLSKLLKEDLKIVKILGSESNKETETDKLNCIDNRIDILVELEPGDIVLIEIKVDRRLNFLHRKFFGTSKIITEYLDEGQPYSEIKKAYSVNILYFDLGQGEDYLYKGITDFIGVHNGKQLQLSPRHKWLYSEEIIKDIYQENYIIKVNNFNDLVPPKKPLEEWMYFFKNEEIKNDFHAKGLLKAKQMFDVLNLSEDDRLAGLEWKNPQNLRILSCLTTGSHCFKLLL